MSCSLTLVVCGEPVVEAFGGFQVAEIPGPCDGVICVQFGDDIIQLTNAQAWALQDAIRRALSPSAANHKCPECGRLGAPSHPCPKTGLTCSCCFECTEKCGVRKPVDLVEVCEPDMWAALEEAKQEEVDGFGIGRLEPVDTGALQKELDKFVVPREKL